MGCGSSSISASALESRLNLLEERIRVLEQQCHQYQKSDAGLNTKQPITPAPLTNTCIDLSQSTAHPILPLPNSTISSLPHPSHSVMKVPLRPFPPPTRIPTIDDRQSRRIEFDVFLSHKRTDTADFARTLKTELTDLHGMSCFLDQDADFELGDLMAKVRASSTLIFILSEHIFESEWCQLELREALLWGCNIILLTSHGARWVVDGQSHDFPPQRLIRDEIKEAFENKGKNWRTRWLVQSFGIRFDYGSDDSFTIFSSAIEYNRNFHKSSIDQLLHRMYGRPVHAAWGEWAIPVRSYEEPARFDIDMSTSLDESFTRIALPPRNSIQILHGLCGWGAPNNEHLVCGLSTPFHLDAPESMIGTTSTDAIVSAAYHLRAEAETPWRSEPERTFASHIWQALLLDGPMQSVQTGVWCMEDFPTLSPTMIDLSYPVAFSVPFKSRPEVFVCLAAFNAHSSHTWRIFSLRTRHIDSSGFDLVLACNGAPNQTVGQPNCQYELDELKVAWLAFDAKLNRSWWHGEIWLTNLDNHRRECETVIHFSSDSVDSLSSVASSRTSFTQPPLVFVSLGGLDSDTRGFDFQLSVTNITTSQCTINWHMYHQHYQKNDFSPMRFGPKPVDNKFQSALSSAQSPPRPPTRVCVKWIALPSNYTKELTL